MVIVVKNEKITKAIFRKEDFRKIFSIKARINKMGTIGINIDPNIVTWKYLVIK